MTKLNLQPSLLYDVEVNLIAENVTVLPSRGNLSTPFKPISIMWNLDMSFVDALTAYI